MTQCLLFYSKIPKTSTDLQESIKDDVRPKFAVLGGTSI